MRRRILRRTVVVPLVLMLALLGPGAAFAGTLGEATAYGYGASLSVLGTDILSPTPEANAGPGPDSGTDELVTAPLDVAFAGVAGAKAQTTEESTITSELGSSYLSVVSGGPALPSSHNARAYSRVTGASVLPSNLGEAVSAVVPDNLGAVLAADLIHSEAMVSCGDGGATVAAGAQIAGLSVLGTDLTDTVDGTLNQVIDLGDTVLSVLGATLVANEVIASEGGVSVNALHLTIPGVAELILAHSEVTDSQCGSDDLPECSDTIDNDGDGAVDFPADPGCADANDDDETDLVRTGGNGPGLGLAILGAGGLLMLAAVRMRKSLLGNI